MDSDNPTLKALFDKRAKLVEQISRLQQDVEALNRSIFLLRGEELDLHTPVSIAANMVFGGMRLSLTKALLYILTQEPKRTWTPQQLRERLVEMKKTGDFETKSTDFYPAMHGILRELSSKNPPQIQRTDTADGKILYHLS